MMTNLFLRLVPCDLEFPYLAKGRAGREEDRGARSGGEEATGALSELGSSALGRPPTDLQFGLELICRIGRQRNLEVGRLLHSPVGLLVGLLVGPISWLAPDGMGARE